jgi:two-component system chemotaxis sensor kinase CheA
MMTMTKDAWDPETTKMLRELFAQEAEEHLDAISAGIQLLGEQPEAVRETLRRAHTLKGSAGTVGYSCLQKAAHLLEELLVDVDEGREALAEPQRQQLMRATDLLRPMVETESLAEAQKLLDEFSVALLSLREGRLEAAGHHTRSPQSSDSELETRVEEARGGDKADDLKVIRVDVSRLDDLMHAVEQLVIERTRMERRVKQLDGLQRDLLASRSALGGEIGAMPADEHSARLGEIGSELAAVSGSLEQAIRELIEDSEALRRTTDFLKEQLTRAKTMPIRWLYARLRRHLREISGIEGKKVRLELIGEETELDRSVLQRINDPLIHLLRNAVAHGIETPGQRLASGKDELGTVRISARQKGEMVQIEIEDDGAGIDARTIRSALQDWSGSLRAARELDQLSDAELLDCIFLSGFSTRRQADAVAGRGVGLDVVHRNVSALGGDIRVSSTVGRGTRFLMQLPLSTAITKALLLREQSVFAVAIAHVVETVVIDEQTLDDRDCRRPLLRRADGTMVPVIWMNEMLGLGQARQSRRAGIVLSHADREFVIACQEVIGPREVVLRKLGRLLSQVGPFASATVSGAGGVQFALDVGAIGELVYGCSFPRHAGSIGPLSRDGARADVSVHQALRAARSDLREQTPPPRILVADDSRTIRDIVSLQLHGAGYLADVARWLGRFGSSSKMEATICSSATSRCRACTAWS